MRDRVGLVPILVLLSACTKEAVPPPPRPPDPHEAELKAVRTELAEERRQSELQRAYIEEATRTINQVQDQLLAITRVETDVRLAPTEPGGGIRRAQKDEMLSKISMIKSQLLTNGKLLADFRLRNAEYAGKVDALEETLGRLQTAVEQKNKEISKLETTVVRMSTEVKALRLQHRQTLDELTRQGTVLVQKDEEIRDKERRLRTGYYFVAGAAELVKKGILKEEKRLFRRTTLKLSEDFGIDEFQAIDISEQKEIAVAALPVKVQLFPSRSASSYHVAANSKTTSTIVIDNPDLFWRFRYLIVATK